MFNRRDFLGIAGGALATNFGRSEQTQRTRRALVVGIDRYSQRKKKATETRRIEDLDGAVNDAKLMAQLLRDRFGFAAANIVLLTDGEATRSRILVEFQRHLIESAVAGDVSFFYYAGHGSQVKNLGSDEPDHNDETLVPADALSGAADIRDKEMARLYRAVLRKNVGLTVVLDSCHSGGMARGGWNATGKSRNAEANPGEINDPPDRDPVSGQKLPDAAEMGLLFLGASRKDQTAGETTVFDESTKQEVPHGAFTAALARVLQSQAANQSVEQICERAQAILAGGDRQQLPICAGLHRRERGLFGQDAGLVSAVTLTVEGLDGRLVKLRGGSALGLADGCTLRRMGGQPIELELVKVELASSRAKVMREAPVGAVKAGDVFEVKTWTAPADRSLKVYFDRDGVAASALEKLAKELEELQQEGGCQVMATPVLNKARPSHILYWKGGDYLVESYPRQGVAVSIGATPSKEQIKAALGGRANARLWTILPPSKQLVADLRLGAGTVNAAIEVVRDAAESTYLLAGQLRNGATEYCWFLKDALWADADQVRLPLETDCTSEGTRLTDLALRLGKINAWLNLTGPSGGDVKFPYRLAFEKAGTQRLAGPGPFKFKEQFKVVFLAAPEVLNQVAAAGGVKKRYVYVFSIDSGGKAQCLFPISADGNVQNYLPRGEATARIVATTDEWDVGIGPPAGTDNYFMIASEEPIDPGVFEWDGVSHGTPRGARTELDLLFGSVGNGTRGNMRRQNVPVNWSIESVAIRSVPE